MPEPEEGRQETDWIDVPRVPVWVGVTLAAMVGIHALFKARAKAEMGLDPLVAFVISALHATFKFALPSMAVAHHFFRTIYAAPMIMAIVLHVLYPEFHLATGSQLLK